jgi:hypothetical protein
MNSDFHVECNAVFSLDYSVIHVAVFNGWCWVGLHVVFCRLCTIIQAHKRIVQHFKMQVEERVFLSSCDMCVCVLQVQVVSLTIHCVLLRPFYDTSNLFLTLAYVFHLLFQRAGRISGSGIMSGLVGWRRYSQSLGTDHQAATCHGSVRE